MSAKIRNGDCVLLADGRIGRVRGTKGASFRVRVRRTSGKTHQFLMIEAGKLRRIACPKGWMSPAGYRRYLEATLAKMRRRRAANA